MKKSFASYPHDETLVKLPDMYGTKTMHYVVRTPYRMYIYITFNNSIAPFYVVWFSVHFQNSFRAIFSNPMEPMPIVEDNAGKVESCGRGCRMKSRIQLSPQLKECC